MKRHRIEFTASENPWAPTAVVAEINARLGAGLSIVGLAEQTGGTSSAAFVEWPDGRPAALTRTLASAGRMRQTAEVLELARSKGIPVPQYQLITELSDGYVAVVQERMSGRHVYDGEPEAVDTIVAENERFAGLLAGRPDVEPPEAFPLGRGADYGVWEQTLGGYDGHTRQLLRLIRVLDGTVPYEMGGDDLVHTDYTFGNILFDDSGRVSGIVDWNHGVGRGDRRYALLALRLGSVGRRLRPAASARVEEHLSRLDPELLRIYQAHWLVHAVHESIRKGFSGGRIQADAEAAEEFLLR